MFVTVSAEETLPVVALAAKPPRDGRGSWTDVVIALAAIILLSPAFLLGLVIYIARKLRRAKTAGERA
jgi:hypothetical protein